MTHRFCQLLLLALLPGAVPAFAQTAPDPAPPEASAPAAVPNVPGYVLVIPAQIVERALFTPVAAARSVPNLFSVPAPGNGALAGHILRGLGHVAPLGVIDPAITTSIDAVPLAGGAASNFGLFETRSLTWETLPGTMSGRSGLAGTLDVRLASPGNRLAGFGEFAAGAFGRRRVAGALDMPLSAGIAVRLEGYLHNDSGWLRNTTTGERQNDQNMAGLRGAMAITITPQLRWQLSGLYMRNDADNLPGSDCTGNGCSGRAAGTGLSGRASLLRSSFAGTRDAGTGQPLDMAGRKALFPLGQETEGQLYVSALSWDAPGFSLEWTAGWFVQGQRLVADFGDGRRPATLAEPQPMPGGSPRGGAVLASDASTRQTTQELRAFGALVGDWLSFVAGVQYRHERSDTDQAAIAAPDLLLADRRLSNRLTGWSSYGQIDLDLGNAVSLSAGLRHTSERRQLLVADNRARCAAPTDDCWSQAALAAAGISDRLRQSALTPRFSALWRLSQWRMGNVQLHASAARGFQGGGWNQFALVPGDARAIDAATAWTLRAGVRGAFFGDRLMIDLAGFRVTASAQPGMVGARDAAGVPMLALGNTAPMTNHGAELAATATPLPGLTLHANIGWQRARFAADAVILAQQASCLAQRAAGGVPLAPGSDDAPACGLGIVTPSGALARPAGTPALTADLGARWDVALPAAGITLTPLVNARYIGETWLEPAGTSLFGGAVRGRSGTLYPANTSAGPLLVGALAPAAWQVQAALQMRTIDGNWLLSLECENCLDTRWVQSQALGQPVLAPPRLWQLRLRRRF